MDPDQANVRGGGFNSREGVAAITSAGDLWTQFLERVHWTVTRRGTLDRWISSTQTPHIDRDRAPLRGGGTGHSRFG
jgi:hypothetical protein